MKTFDEWKELGYHVIKGGQSQSRNKNDEAVFTREQVEESDYRDYDDEVLSHEDLFGD